MTQDEIARRVQDYRRKAMEQFPLKLIEATGEQALAKWQELKSAGQGTPVVLRGDDDGGSFSNLLDPFGPNGPYVPPLPSVEDILKKAAGIQFPDDLAKRKKADSEAALQRMKDMLAAKPDMPLPTITKSKGGQTRTLTREETIAAMVGQPLQNVLIGLAPTDDWTTIPAILRWGGWNGCPAAEYHVAAMRNWRDRYGAELIGMSFDTINLRVAVRPKTREEALALARDQYVCCADNIDQGVGTYCALAAALMESDWWYFWRD